MSAPLLLEIGCEEIPARMIHAAAADLAVRVGEILAGAGVAHGPAVGWGGSRRLAVRVEAVADRQPDRDEQVLGPPVKTPIATFTGPSLLKAGPAAPIQGRTRESSSGATRQGQTRREAGTQSHRTPDGSRLGRRRLRDGMPLRLTPKEWQCSFHLRAVAARST